ncbi:ImmA/IrrE family metallo-endopeptidase [Acetobacterium carbinolicum]|uniref:ImmA/IrrE family metallo-endopeptidase n=1 Tax=Acetobacterium carbinolicum TaxID=52690 RepID=UPI0039BF8979
MKINEKRILSTVKDIIEIFNLTYPLDIDEFVEKLNIDLKFIDTGNCDGLFLCHKGKKKILINKSANRLRKNFTIGHELGHYFIEHHLSQLYDCNIEDKNNIKGSVNSNRLFEQEADIFSGELLLPTEILRKENYCSLDRIRTISKKYGISIPATAIKVMHIQKEPMVFMQFNKNSIIWHQSSIGETSNCHNLSNMLSIPDTSHFYKLNKYGYTMREISSYGWLVDEFDDPSVKIKEEIIYCKDYDYGYILLDLSEVYKRYELE